MDTNEINPVIDLDSFSTAGPNTEFSYMYRDADNYKQNAQVIMPGVLTFEQALAIVDGLDEDEGFVPSAVGLNDLQERMVNGWDEDVDHPYHEITGIALTDRQPTIQMTASDFVERFAAADWGREGERVSTEHA